MKSQKYVHADSIYQDIETFISQCEFSGRVWVIPVGKIEDTIILSVTVIDLETVNTFFAAYTNEVGIGKILLKENTLDAYDTNNNNSDSMKSDYKFLGSNSLIFQNISK